MAAAAAAPLDQQHRRCRCGWRRWRRERRRRRRRHQWRRRRRRIRAGAGGSNTATTSAAGFGGGGGGGLSAGGGGSALGGNIFVQQGGTLTVVDSNVSGGTVTAGTGSTNGVADGRAIYLMAGTNLSYLTNTASTISEQIGGPGSLTKTGTSTLNLSGANDYTGATNVNQGTLIVSGSTVSPTFVNSVLKVTGTASGLITVNSGGAADILGTAGTTVINSGGALNLLGSVGTTTVNSGGALNGTGQVGPTVVNGTVSPGFGSTIGTLTVNGSLTQNSGSTYNVKFNSFEQSDLIKVLGHAQLNGASLNVEPSNGAYFIGERFTILTATTGVSGTYGASNTAFPGFLQATPVYLPDAVQLVLSSNFRGGALTFNQASVSAYLDANAAVPAGDLGTVVAALSSLNPSQLQTLSIRSAARPTKACSAWAGCVRCISSRCSLIRFARASAAWSRSNPMPFAPRWMTTALRQPPRATGNGRDTTAWEAMSSATATRPDSITTSTACNSATKDSSAIRPIWA